MKSTPDKGKSRVRFFSSPKEQEDELVTYWASITPVERMRHLQQLIIKSYGLTTEQIRNPQLSNRITFHRTA